MKISTNMEAGKRLPITVRCGSPRLRRGGHLITTAIGFGKAPGDGRGSKLSRGATLRSTMAVGCMAAATGVGLRDRSGSVRTMLRLWSRGLADRDGARISASVSAEVLAGARWDLGSRSFRGITPDLVTSTG